MCVIWCVCVCVCVRMCVVCLCKRCVCVCVPCCGDLRPNTQPLGQLSMLGEEVSGYPLEWTRRRSKKAVGGFSDRLSWGRESVVSLSDADTGRVEQGRVD